MFNRILIMISIALGSSAFTQVGMRPNNGAPAGTNSQTVLIGNVGIPGWCRYLRHPSEDICGSGHQTEPETKPAGAKTGGVPPQHDTAPPSQTAFAMTYGVLKLGAGGAVTGIDIQCDQGFGKCALGTGTVTKLSRNNTNGAYWFNPNASGCGNADATGCWQPVVSVNSLPANDPAIADGLRGAYDAIIAPSNTSHFWMIYDGYVYSSLNKGATWTQCSPARADDEANGVASGGLTRHLAVDPANEWSVIAALPSPGTGASGVIYSDGTADACSDAWTSIPSSSILQPTQSKVGDLIAFDASTTSDGSTPGIYIFSYGRGVYHTSTGLGGTWSLTPGGPTTFSGVLIVGRDGVVWTIDASVLELRNGNANGGIGGLWRLKNRVWANLLVGSRGYFLNDVIVNPNNPKLVYAKYQQVDRVRISTDGGATWSSETPNNNPLIATDIPWIAYRSNCTGCTSPSPFGAPGAIIDPVTNTTWMGGGLGIFTSNFPASGILTASSDLHLRQRRHRANGRQSDCRCTGGGSASRDGSLGPMRVPAERTEIPCGRRYCEQHDSASIWLVN